MRKRANPIYFEAGDEPDSSGGMKRDWRSIVRAMTGRGGSVTMADVSRRMGKPASWLSDTLKDEADPRLSNFIAMAHALGYSPGKLLDGENPASLPVPIEGIVAAGEGWVHPDDAPPGSVELTLGEEDMIGIEVRGNSMSPVYRDGDLLLCKRRSGRFVDNLIGLDCAVLTTDGVGYLKILKRGTQAGLYNLKSYDPYTEEIENVDVKWAAPIVWIKRDNR